MVFKEALLMLGGFLSVAALKPARVLAREVVGGGIAMPILLGAVVVLGMVAPVTEDVVGRVAYCVPPVIAKGLVRDSRLAWRVFTLFEILGAFALLVATEAKRRRVDVVAAATGLARTYSETEPLRVELSKTCAVEVHRKKRGPLVLFVPGGAWCHSDDARMYRLLASRCPFDLAVVEHVPYPLTTGAHMVQDVGLAVDWALNTSPRVICLAHSAGAQLLAAALLDGDRTRVPTATVLCAGPFDLNKHLEYEMARGVADVSALAAAFPTQDTRTRLSPANRAASDGRLATNTVVLVHGAKDDIVPVVSTHDFAKRLLLGASTPVVETHILPEADHISYILDASLSPHATLFQIIRDLARAIDHRTLPPPQARLPHRSCFPGLFRKCS
ncbi:hypothetical protein CTAYLR_006344 [Chrysophaeum taylorii]|uniref:Peptidase S9 prolyl oligopeptidase catalytic domain-containing protein n=1 Tax=Chrysophaeum taylorii TaxID=2483200 RepID=A0AAD7U879_9STRA|nr:hypothetical protein CTAYLR_006344 [Chrysophaeum taylorii]